MRFLLHSVGLCAILAVGAVAAADDATTASTGIRTQPVHTANVDTNALLQQTVWKGLLFSAPTNSAAGVVAVLKQDKHQKTGAFLLRTEDPILYTRMQDLGHAHKGTSVVLNGRLDPDGITVRVTDLLELPKERKPERK